MTATYLDTAHFFQYDSKIPVTAGALAESLLGLEAVVKKSAGVLNRLFDVHIRDTEVLVTSFEFGSYKENLVFRFFFGKGREAERNIEKLRTQLGLKNMDFKRATAIVVTGAVLYAGYRFLPSTPSPASVHIENSFNNLGQELGFTKDELIAIFEASIRNPDDLKKQVSRMAHPGAVPHGGTMTLDNDTQLSIPPDVISVITPGYTRDEPDEPFKDFDNTQIVIRAIDLDRPATGWAGIVPTISDKRLPVALADGLDPSTVPAGKNTDADVTVIYKVDKHGNKEPKRYLLRKIHQKP
jgi:hypothetical protein